MEHYGWCVGALWVVCGSIRERNYRLKKKNYLSGPTPQAYFLRSTAVKPRPGVVGPNIDRCIILTIFASFMKHAVRQNCCLYCCCCCCYCYCFGGASFTLVAS